jgi:hypothetical protein
MEGITINRRAKLAWKKHAGAFQGEELYHARENFARYPGAAEHGIDKNRTFRRYKQTRGDLRSGIKDQFPRLVLILLEPKNCIVELY